MMMERQIFGFFELFEVFCEAVFLDNECDFWDCNDWLDYYYGVIPGELR